MSRRLPDNPERARPEEFLRLIEKSRRGKLKAYLGHAAGVGKTCAMLQEAHRLKTLGVDVVIGWVETHGRVDTEKLLSGLELLPRLVVPHRETMAEALDVAGILQRAPTVCVVDELPFSNPEGSKNAKRYLDVEDLLAAGVSVITALNIQHVESLHDTVQRLTDVDVRERVPDRFLRAADEVVNVDLPSEELRERLRRGQIYPPERAKAALENFFQIENLVALREIALRETAIVLDAHTQGQDDDAEFVGEKIAVFFSTNPETTSRLLRSASRLAGRLNREWIAVYIRRKEEDPLKIPSDLQRKFLDNVQLAQSLGAKVVVIEEEPIERAMLNFCQSNEVKFVVLGKSHRRWWQIFRPNPIQYLMKNAPGIDLHIVDTQDLG